MTARHRNEELLAQRRAGLTYTKIAENYGMTPQRVRQIVQKEEAREAERAVTRGIMLDPERIEREWAKIDARCA